MMVSMGFHEGELLVQQRAQVADRADQLAGMLRAPRLDGGMAAFAAERDHAVITARDPDGRLWTSPVFGEPGFLRAYAATLEVHAVPLPGDPLHVLTEGGPVGSIMVDYARRRRLRVNGTLARVGRAGFTIEADQAYGNCPQHIPRREATPIGEVRPVVTRHEGLTPEVAERLRAADSFLLGTVHPERGADASHRGGPAGFVQVDGGVVGWPELPGNNLFNSLGNLAVDPEAAMLVLDLRRGRSLQLSGTAQIEWAGTDRRVRFVPEVVVETSRLLGQ
jgi:uncharacterized protein